MAFQTPYTSKQPVTDFSLPFSTSIWSVTLPTATNVALLIPGTQSRWIAIMRATDVAGASTWVSYDTPFVAPGATFAEAEQELLGCCGVAREVSKGDTLYFYTTGTGVSVSVDLYAYLVNN